MSSIEDEYDEEEKQMSMKSTIKSIALPILFVIAVAFFYRDHYFCSMTNGVMISCWPTWQFALAVFPMWWSFMAFEKELKLNSAKVTWTDGSTSYDERIYPAGDFYIVRAGGFKWMAFYRPGKEGLLIFHKTAMNQLGRQIAVAARLKPTPYRDLDFNVQQAIKAYGFMNLKPFRYGLVDPQRYQNLIKVSKKTSELLPGKLTQMPATEFEELIKSANRQRTAFEKIGDTSLNKMEGYEGKIARINETKSIMERMGERISKKPREESDS